MYKIVHITPTPHFGAIRELCSVPAGNNEVRLLWPLPFSDFYDGIMARLFEWFLVSEGLASGERR